MITIDRKLSRWKEIFFLLESAIKINQKIHLLKPPWVTLSLFWLRAGDTEEESAGSHVWDRKKENHSGRLCPLFKQWHRGWERGVGGEEEEEEGGVSKRRIRGKKGRSFSQLPSLGPKIWSAFLVSASPAIRSRLSLFYLSQSAHTLSFRHTYARLRSHTPSAPPWSTFKCCQCQILQHGQLKQSGRKQAARFCLLNVVFIQLVKYRMISSFNNTSWLWKK